MRIFAPHNYRVVARGLLLAVATIVVAPLPGRATGFWQTINNFPYSTPGHMLLLTDGSVMIQNNGNNGWYSLQPDSNGHYLNGNWSTLNSMTHTRTFYASQVLRNGKVLVAGGEYGDAGSGSSAEIFDPRANFPAGLWTPTPSPGVGFGDAESVLLANGQVMVEPVGFYKGSGAYTFLYDPASNQWTPGPTDLFYQDESTWVKLPDNSILTVDIFTGGTTSERYIPYFNTNNWVPDEGLPVSMAGGKSEVGGAFMMADGRAFWLGGSGFTAFYKPSGNTNNGHWTRGPNMPYFSGTTVYTDSNNNYVNTNYSGLLTARDTPAAMMNNGKILCQLVAGPFHNQVWFYEYDPAVTNFVAAPNPVNTTPGAPFLPGVNGQPQVSDGTSMLDLPDGTVLYNDTVGLYLYTPDGSPHPAGKPTIISTSWSANGSLHISGTLFNGISQGASFGDDAQQDSNYPLVRFFDGNGTVTYGRTYNWSTTGVQSGGKVMTTEVALPASLYAAPGPYTLQVVVNGNGSARVPFNEPTWVDFTYTGSTEDGSYVFPYNTLAKGTNYVSSGGNIVIKGALSHETMTISKPMTITSVGGAATVGQ